MKCSLDADGRCVECGSGGPACRAEVTLAELRAMEAGTLPARPVRVTPVQLAALHVLLSQGPGTELATILASLGIGPDDKDKCGCKALAAQMNRWGPAGCREHKDEIVAKLIVAYHTVSVPALLPAAARAARFGLAFQLSPLDPFGSLLELAIRRAEDFEQQAAKEAKSGG